jgi:signal transduction histidine kinase
VIFAPRREGSLSPVDTRSDVAPLWRRLDRIVPLGVKLIVPVIAVTLAGTFLFGLLLTQSMRHNLETVYIANADASAQAASTAFYSTINDPERVNAYLADIASSQPAVNDISIIDVGLPGSPVVAGSKPSDIGRTDVVRDEDVQRVLAGQPDDTISTVHGHSVLQTIFPVMGNAYAVVIWTSLDDEDRVVANTVNLVGGVGLLICMLEIGALFAVLEFGIVRRIKRIGNLVHDFRAGAGQARLSEGSEPEGNDVLFNLARSVDHKLMELGARERAGEVVNELGLMSLQGTAPEELTRRALEIVRRAGDLDRCFLVDSAGAVTIVAAGDTAETTAAKLPIWLGALVRSAAQSRRPLLTDGLGQESRYWEAGSTTEVATAAFVPLAGNPNPIGVMVGVARPSMYLSSVTISMMEAVAAALGESVQRSEAEKARHESEVKSRALSTVSHEMRNPLNAMLGFGELLLTGAAGPLNPKQENYVRRVDEASHHLLRLVDDYLDLARIMNGSLPMQPEAVVVAKEVESVIDLLQPTADEKSVSLRIDASPAAVARADRMRLRQVLLNLVSNAIKFTPARGHVRVEVAGGSNGVRISVIDTGVGIAADQQHLVFTEFARLRTNGAKQGAGLGLALSRRFVDAMGGFIRFTSSEGAGTIFDVWLPGEQSPTALSADGATAKPNLKTAV